MFQKKKVLISSLLGAVVVVSLSFVACAPSATQGEESDAGTPITVDNDSVEAGEQGVVTDPTAGAKTGPEQSGGVEFDSLGSTALPDGYVPQGDLLALTLGASPPIPHGSANGTNCMSCHETGTGGAPGMTKSHLDAGLSDEYCITCHKDAQE